MIGSYDRLPAAIGPPMSHIRDTMIGYSPPEDPCDYFTRRYVVSTAFASIPSGGIL